MRPFAIVGLVVLTFFLARPLAAAERAIGVFGDSLGDGVWSALTFLLKKNEGDKVFRYTKVGAGLTRPDFPAWIEELPKNLEVDRITHAVVMVGANDLQSVRDENRRGFLFGTPGWKQVYQARIEKMLDAFAARDIPVVWLGLPIMAKDESNQGSQTLSEVFVAATAKGKRVTYLPLIDDFKGEGGAFVTHLPDDAGKSRQVRLEDGIHFTHYGYERIALKVLARFADKP
ncbi:SGNH/GDSL hydrolase family protein [Magnetospirillum moscoviense]|uniref:Uncharacterized protein n=1 Tax=Magnetospirillum moscoviense TaxID=1437059 RepID=A0A178MX97_9PROT|nr:DUF459 domain-containing protein [Magnetospirillum moscoviense]MBF0325447.1 DUF459 domain-containing protein [Alphaproteobacteria bacterium]OAN55722.1 hypothetical protein A6A05_08185 [Magnetospirillum moscoviense]